METVAVLVPDGLQPGDTFDVCTEWGATFTLACPAGSAGGETVAVDLPTFESVSSQVDALDAVRRFVEEEDTHFLARVQDFCRAHAHHFGDSSEVRLSSVEECREYPLEYTRIHQAFEALVEELLHDFIASIGLDVNDFVDLVARSGAEDKDRLLRAIDAATDFDVFLMMVHEAKEGTLVPPSGEEGLSGAGGLAGLSLGAGA